MVKRIISGGLLIALIIVVIFNAWACNLAITLFIIGGLYEFFTMLEKKGISIYKYVGIAIGALIPLSIMSRFEPTKNWEFLFIIIVLLALIIMQFRRRESCGVIVGISTTVFGILYVSWFFSFLIKIRHLEGGLGFLAAVLIITKLGDMGAYFVGSKLGKTPLIPRISPKKSVEGAIGGLLASVLGALISKPFLNFNYAHLIFIGLALGILAQLGDLSESLMKRDCQIKDSGNIFPGLGGILDSIDSLLFTAPVFYFYINTIIINR